MLQHLLTCTGTLLITRFEVRKLSKIKLAGSQLSFTYSETFRDTLVSGIMSHPSNVLLSERYQDLALSLPSLFWVRESGMLSTDTCLDGVFGFAMCSYLGNVDLTLSGISITQDSAALKWLPA